MSSRFSFYVPESFIGSNINDKKDDGKSKQTRQVELQKLLHIPQGFATGAAGNNNGVNNHGNNQEEDIDDDPHKKNKHIKPQQALLRTLSSQLTRLKGSQQQQQPSSSLSSSPSPSNCTTAKSMSTTTTRVSIPQLALTMMAVFLLGAYAEHLFTHGLPNRRRSGAIRYSCPVLYDKDNQDESTGKQHKALNDRGGAFEFYNDKNDQLLLRGTTHDDDNNNGALHDNNAMLHWQDLETLTFDGWEETFAERRNGRFGWVRDQYQVKSGDNIYESACGIGLGLLMTMKILEEAHGITNLGLYGNEYRSSSVVTARSVMQQLSPQNQEVVCQGDSTRLGFVPTSSFDLVYTGYIDPIVDPLQMSNGSLKDQSQQVKKLCRSTTKEGKLLSRLSQEREEDWFASWVSELVRIAKPGCVVAIEEISPAICSSGRDWGGVDKTWWKTAIDKYEWDVDPDSIIVQNVKRKTSKRYNVAMRKNGKSD